jgi:SAM-dependent methyltransferase
MDRIPTEAERVSERYARRRPGDLYHVLRPEVLRASQELDRAIAGMLAHLAKRPAHELRLLEVGCGSGSNLTKLLALGLDPDNMVANELLPERVSKARHNLPAAVTILPGDATVLDLPAARFDIVYCSLVFSSILDDAFQARLAASMWNWVAPGGAVLWYDFIYNNPSNKDVRGMPVRRIRQLFPDAQFTVRRVTLAPPISRRVCRVWAGAYGLFNALPLLRSHVLCWLAKPR